MSHIFLNNKKKLKVKINIEIKAFHTYRTVKRTKEKKIRSRYDKIMSS